NLFNQKKIYIYWPGELENKEGSDFQTLPLNETKKEETLFQKIKTHLDKLVKKEAMEKTLRFLRGCLRGVAALQETASTEGDPFSLSDRTLE
ncbi:hypothetical protein CEXT_77431, partial [Caerostris extrusa]